MYEQEEYSKFYIVQALFKLMKDYPFDEIGITDVARKAGVGRATFYRHFRSKNDVILYYFEHNRKEFVYDQRFIPRCKADYVDLVTTVFEKFRSQKNELKLIRKARLEYFYLDYLNRNFTALFNREHPEKTSYAPYLYAGMLFNVSMNWLDNDCAEDPKTLAKLVVDSIYFAD